MTSVLTQPQRGAADEYWTQTRQPLLCLAFLLPLLAVYEAGVIWVGGESPETVRNGADFWMRDWLRTIGLDHALLLPSLVLGGLLAWHVIGKYPWRLSPPALAGMFAESLLFALILVVVGLMTDLLFRHAGGGTGLAMFQREETLRAISFLGAGVYEEFLFRLCLFPACYGLFRVLRTEGKWAAGLAILSTSLIFSLAHYVGPSAETISLFTFTFRALAGGFFAALFVTRGFGITVGCHAAYDLLVGVLMQG